MIKREIKFARHKKMFDNPRNTLYLPLLKGGFVGFDFVSDMLIRRGA